MANEKDHIKVKIGERHVHWSHLHLMFSSYKLILNMKANVVSTNEYKKMDWCLKMSETE